MTKTNRSNQNQYGTKELFKYVKIEPLKIINLRLRAKKVKGLKALIDKSAEEQAKWAKEFIKSDKVINNESDLRYDYFTHLKIAGLPPHKLPSKYAIKDLDAFKSISFKDESRYKADYENCAWSLLAFKILKDEDKLNSVTKILNFLELFPELHKVKEEKRYAPAIINKTSFKTPSIKAKEENTEIRLNDKQTYADLKTLSNHISILWGAKNKLLEAKKKEFDAAYKEIINTIRNSAADVSVKKHGKTKNKNLHSGIRKEYSTFINERKTNLVALKKEYQNVRSAVKLYDMIVGDSKEFSKYLPGKSDEEVAIIQKNVKELLKKYDIQTEKFSKAYEQAVLKADSLEVPVSDTFNTDCFKENPDLVFRDTIRILGKAQLIRVDETFIKYEAGEISYIENILAGEVKKREVKNTKYFEQVSESITEDIAETSEEKSSSSKQELSSQIESELNTRFNSDINSSINGSGSGTIGVVDLEGGATVGANLGIGVDTVLSTSNSSNFSQEIINKAIEKTKKTTIEKRLSRSYSLYETTDLHEINNTAGGKSLNGIYCFLDKHVCITETLYGVRLFLLSNISLPGRNLLCEKTQKIKLTLSELGAKPVFDISPNDINPGNYKELAGRFKAANLQPPPSPILTIGKTYKTDSTNVNVEQQEFKIEKIAGTLAPFFEAYKRFLVTDNIKLPDGYEVREVNVTVNHGNNGISIPAHLPLKLAGAALGTGLTLASAASSGFGPGVLIPLGIWQFEYSASPLLHYNTDSSNVTVCIGNESHDSPYYFFQPDFLIKEVFEMLGNFSAIGPDLLNTIKANAEKLLDDLKDNADKVPDNIKDIVKNTIDKVIDNIKNVLDSISISGSLKKGFHANFDFNALVHSIVDVNALAALAVTMKDLFTPLKTFIDGIIQLIKDGMQDALSDLFSFLSEMFENSQTLPFYSCAGMKGELPVSFNTIAVKPGVTINLTACLQRTEEGLDKWRLETFDNLYQSYLQLLAEYESKTFISGNAGRITKSPGALRNEEHLALKELILNSLNNYHDASGNTYTLDKMNLFENAIDWKNMSYKLYNYGPNGNEIKLEKMGAFSGVDDRRKTFIKALWAQALIPLQPDEHLENQIRQYFADGTFDFNRGLDNEELTALYRDLILDRELIEEEPQVISHRVAVIPTDFIVIQEKLPENTSTLCNA